jgi:plastocyanin
LERPEERIATMKKLLVLLTALALAAFGLAACGGDDSSDTTSAATEETTATGGGGGATVKFEADPDGALAYTQTDVSAPAGSDTIEFDNPASLGHDVVIEDSDGNEVARTDVISGSTTTTDADLQAGTYTFFCSVDGHRDAGMEGTLTVK